MKDNVRRGFVLVSILILGVSLVASCGDTPMKRLLQGAITGTPQIVMVIDPLDPPPEVSDIVDVQGQPLNLATSALKLVASSITTQVGADLVMGQPFLILGYNFGWFPTVTIDGIPAPVLLVEGKGNFTVILAQVPSTLVGRDGAGVQVVNDEGYRTPSLDCSIFRLGAVLNRGSNSLTRFYASYCKDIDGNWVMTGTHYPRTSVADVQFGGGFNLDTFQLTPDGLFVLGLDVAQKAVALSPLVDLPKDLLTRQDNASDISFPVTVKIEDIA
ncbi:MAG: hypothetical protein ACYS8W_21760, partial [Planctomycetota bacterium]